MIPLWQLALLVSCPAIAFGLLARSKTLAIVVALLAVWVFTARAAENAVTLRGRLTGAADASETGLFFVEVDNLGTLTLNVGELSYMGDFLNGGIGHRVKILIGPDDQPE